ncbi:MAG: hypothetical protein LBQ89_08945, partial [Treponema sp.]|nr:hypothetical protein [Treponema sp.]
MKLKYKLSLMMIGITVIVVSVIALILVLEASRIARKLSLEGIRYLAANQVTYWKGQEDGSIMILRTLANVMSDYEYTPAELRRDQFDHMLFGTMTSNPSFINIYVVWKPNAVDGMDSRFIGRTGSTATGQYAIA